MGKTLKQFFTVFFVAMLFGTIGFAADEFGQINDIVGSADTAGKTTLGSVGTWAFGLILPIGSIVIGAIIGFTTTKKKIEQTQDGVGKLYAITAGYAIAGAFVFAIFTSLIFFALTGDPSNGFKVISNFWKEVFQI